MSERIVLAIMRLAVVAQAYGGVCRRPAVFYSCRAKSHKPPPRPGVVMRYRNFKRFRRLALCLALCPLMFAVTLPKYITDRFRGPNVQVREVEGVQDRVQAGKLYLTVKDFIALVLKNNTEINLTRLDVLTAADAILAAKAPFDPNLVAGFNSIRAETPQFSQIGGAEQLNNLSQQTTLGFQQTLSSGQVLNLGFNANRSWV